MASFTDPSGRTWKVVLRPPAIKRVRAALGIDLPALAVEPAWGRLGALLGDPETIVNVLHAICRPEAERRGVSPEDFGRLMAEGSMLDTLVGTIVPFADVLNKMLGVDLRDVADDALARLGIGEGAEAAAESRRQALQALDDQQSAADEARFAGARASLAADDAELSRLQAELAEAIAEAGASAASKAAGPDDLPARGTLRDFGGITPESLDEAVGRTAAKADVAGTFSATAAAGMGVGTSVEGEQLDEARKQTGILQRLDDRARQGRLVFTD